ncbi:MAG: hypothetical protein ACLFU8_00405 [Anaerolineales bacterium]
MRKRERFFNVLTLMTLVLTLLVVVYYGVVAANPQTPLNPFPPSTGVALFIVQTNTPTPEGLGLPATWTPTATSTATPTRAPTFTPTVTRTPTPFPTLQPTSTPTPLVTRSPYPFSYEVSYETPYYGCNWSGVAGLVQDLEGNPLEGYAVHIWGGGLDEVIHSGDYPMYGASGWEQFFNNHPIQVSDIYHVQLHDKNPPHAPVSPVIKPEFEGYCSSSMAFIVFTMNH